MIPFLKNATLTACLSYLALSWLLLAPAYASEGDANTEGIRAELMEQAEALHLRKIEAFNEGVAGKYKNSYFYFGHQSQLSDPDRFYWAMVRLLSEKYACFMVYRTKGEDHYAFRCRDGRHVVIQHGQKGQIVYFAARSFPRGQKPLIPQTTLVSH